MDKTTNSGWLSGFHRRVDFQRLAFAGHAHCRAGTRSRVPDGRARNHCRHARSRCCCSSLREARPARRDVDSARGRRARRVVVGFPLLIALCAAGTSARRTRIVFVGLACRLPPRSSACCAAASVRKRRSGCFSALGGGAGGRVRDAPRHRRVSGRRCADARGDRRVQARLRGRRAAIAAPRRLAGHFVGAGAALLPR